jgi:hypothetical protein
MIQASAALAVKTASPARIKISATNVMKKVVLTLVNLVSAVRIPLSTIIRKRVAVFVRRGVRSAIILILVGNVLGRMLGWGVMGNVLSVVGLLFMMKWLRDASPVPNTASPAQTPPPVTNAAPLPVPIKKAD